MFKSLLRTHTELLLNPFFEPCERADDENECFDDDVEGTVGISGSQRYIDLFKQKLDEVALFYDKYF